MPGLANFMPPIKTVQEIIEELASSATSPEEARSIALGLLLFAELNKTSNGVYLLIEEARKIQAALDSSKTS